MTDWNEKDAAKYISVLTEIIKFHENEIESIRAEIKALERRLNMNNNMAHK